MKVYEAIFKEGENEGVYALGMVYDPAMQDTFIKLKDEDIKLSIDEEKRMVFGAVLIPNKDIPRTDGNGNTFAIRFSEETIEKLGHNWVKKGSHVNFTEQHQTKLNGLAAVEMWTVKDPDKDTSNYYGKRYDKGTLVALSHVNNDDTWAKIKSGEINGYSIEALMGLQEIQLNTNTNNMTEEVKKDIVTQVIDGVKALFSTKEEETTENIEVKSEEVVENEFDKEAFMAEVIETVKAEFSAQTVKELDEVKAQFTKQIDELTKENEKLKLELSKQPEVESVKLSKSDEAYKPVIMTGKTISERVFSAING